MGFVSALIVGPCVTAPLAGALLYIAQTGDVVLGAAALFFLGLGKGVPLIVFGTAGARFLPKAGPWMNRVKTAFGFAFLGMAWWLAGRILPPAVTLATGAALSFAAAAVLGLFSPATNNLISNLARSAGLAVSLWGALILIGLGLGAVDPWRPLAPLMSANSGAAATPSVVPTAIVEDQATLEQALARAADVRRPAVLYFTADWCTICKAVDRRVLADPATIAAFAAADLIKVDVTQNTEETRDLMKRYGVAGPPTMIFLTASSTEATGVRLIGDMTAQQVQTALEHAGARS
jgi:thiol:disulfide interchange protein DsbD